MPDPSPWQLEYLDNVLYFIFEGLQFNCLAVTSHSSFHDGPRA